MTVRLKLSREWVLGERIGGGGFGEVYATHAGSEQNSAAALAARE